MRGMEWRKDDYVVTDDSARMDVEAVIGLLRQTYWAKERPRELIERSLQNALCFSVFRGGKQIAFGRLISDFATVTYICDVVVDASERGQGTGTWLLECLLSHPRIQGTRVDLFTADAQDFYRRKFGFTNHKYESMSRYPPETGKSP